MASTPRSINVEPLLFLFGAGNMLYSTLYQAVFAYKQCLAHLPGEHAICQNLGSNKPDQGVAVEMDTRSLLNEVQASTAQYLILYQMASTIPSVFIGIFAGAWCDKYGRKPPLVAAAAGSAIAIFVGLLCASIDALPPTTLIYAALIKGCTGQVVVIHMASFAMISDIVTTKDRANVTLFSVRIGIASGLSTLGGFLGSLLAGLLLDYFHNYAYVYAFGCAFMTLALIYAVFVLKETIHWPHIYADCSISNQLLDEKKNPVQESIKNKDCCDDAAKVAGDKNCCFSLLEKMRQTFDVLIRERPGRCRLYLLTSYICFLTLAAFEPGGILLLYVKRPPLSFGDSQYSYLNAASMVGMVFGKMVIAVLLKRLFKTSDMSLILIGLMFTIGNTATLAFSTEAWMVVAAVCVGSLSAISTVGFRSFFGSLVDSSERGRMFAAVFIIDELGPLLASLIINNLYALTLPIFPGAVYILKSVVTALVFIALGWVHIDSRIHPADNLDRCTSGCEFEKETTPLLGKTKKVTV